MPSVTYSEILSLPPAERLQLLEVIWDSLTEMPEAIPLPEGLRDELDRRLENYYRDPASARPWSEIRDEVFRRR